MKSLAWVSSKPESVIRYATKYEVLVKTRGIYMCLNICGINANNEKQIFVLC